MANFWEKIKSFFDRRPPYCKQCKREETRPEYIEKWQCSFCYGPLVSARERDQR